MYRNGQFDCSGAGSLGFFSDYKAGIKSVAFIDRCQKAARLLQESDQGLAHLMCQRTGSDGGLYQCLKSVRHQSRVAKSLKIGAVVMNRMIVAGHRLKCSEDASGHGSGRCAEHFTDFEVIKGAGR